MTDKIEEEKIKDICKIIKATSGIGIPKNIVARIYSSGKQETLKQVEKMIDEMIKKDGTSDKKDFLKYGKVVGYYLKELKQKLGEIK